MHISTLFTATTVAFVTIADIASAHVVLVDAYGNANKAVRGYALGFDAATPRNGGYLYPQQRDVTVFANKVVHHPGTATYLINTCGTTLQHTAWYYQKHEKSKWFDVSDDKRTWLFSQATPHKGYIDIPAGIAGLAWNEWKKNTRTDLATGRTKLKTGIPKVTRGGSLSILAFQINLDGGGAFQCKIDYLANGRQWARKLNVRKNCPGDAHSFNWPGVQKTCWFTVDMPNDLDCKGKTGSKNEVTDICLVRCENSAKNGPFGGCIPVQQIRPKPKVVKSVKPVKPVKPVVSVKPVKVTVVKAVQPTIAPPKPVTVTKNKFVTIIKGGQTQVSKITKNTVLTLTQVIKPPPKTTVEIQYTTVTVESSGVSTEAPEPDGTEEVDDKDDENDDANKPTPEPEPSKEPTKEEIKAALGGEEYPEEDIKDIKEEKVTDDVKDALKDNSGKEKMPDEIGEQEQGYY
ncbi:hypothetical protein AOL_s00007g320 [Orbilia oligospora ATCC 24927]|uniref:Uncharacterized protein n=1 Tax=Arthrobotrys oligospora (strain ATCC 24927 / CBS 115.81 / DSM 1491) TaxID=756982 RepID=G1X211_ARTOA|nr:hypothetical protein AOL_s00007g320 [Orbilia oligospora ATCC 24927]EGX52984.1 hypothetical protein AOL_s00007g320 [Orbilia oligospora ATCC 24927]